MIEAIGGEEVRELRNLQSVLSDAGLAIDDLLALRTESEPEVRGATRYALQLALGAVRDAMEGYV